jgi:hypothetical protein
MMSIEQKVVSLSKYRKKKKKQKDNEYKSGINSLMHIMISLDHEWRGIYGDPPKK